MFSVLSKNCDLPGQANGLSVNELFTRHQTELFLSKQLFVSMFTLVCDTQNYHRAFKATDTRGKGQNLKDTECIDTKLGHCQFIRSDRISRHPRNPQFVCVCVC